MLKIFIWESLKKNFRRSVVTENKNEIYLSMGMHKNKLARVKRHFRLHYMSHNYG